MSVSYHADVSDIQKDYIPNLGDCIDLVILGAGWDVDRARELRGTEFTICDLLLR